MVRPFLKVTSCQSYVWCGACAGDSVEPPGADQQRLHARAGLPHGAHRLQVRRDQGEVRPSYWYEFTCSLLKHFDQNIIFFLYFNMLSIQQLKYAM